MFEKKRARAAKISEKRSRDCLLPASKEKLLPVFGPSYVPILNENMAKSSPLSRNDQTFCCPFPFSGFPQIVSSVSSSSSSLPRRARCSFNAFNAFISFFFGLHSQISNIIHHPRVVVNQKSQNERQRRRTKLSLSLSLVSKKTVRLCVFVARKKQRHPHLLLNTRSKQLLYEE